ncbi:putative bifunctional diguanylate cyclase/phosphodiesterase [Planktothrix mougeotii]|uniref:EAL domain-containing protein n=1 Tax=Planktothrix mougeotii LEGE 06226 TaxID=1828728 RepID=A0ABR9UJ93_9CYAN|nr:EAL domain-containing protein [Planktothrix mougeotii]MBE9146520.1 EAL domain-containing protein [Planktothrix mougeotii LEGE 06226]
MKRDRFLSKNLALQVASLYAFLGSIWIFLSDQLLAFFSPNPRFLTQIQTLKGVIFLLITSVLLYFFVSLGTRRLQDSEQRYRTLFFAHPQPMWVYDLKTLKFLAVNEAAIEHYGYSETEFLSMKITEIRPPEDIPRLSESLSKIQIGQNRVGIWRHHKKDGTLMAVEVTGHTINWKEKFAEVVLAQDVTERLQTKAQLERYAFNDLLTGLANRSLLLERLQYALQHPQKDLKNFAVLSFDIDRFKPLKYGFGHLLAEQLLIAVSQRLQTCVSPRDVVARVGTDEFAILLTDIANSTVLSEKIERIHTSLDFPFRLDTVTISSPTSIGIVLDKLQSQRPEDYLQAADTAMYYAKQQGRGATVFYEPSMATVVAEHLQLEADLQRAIERQQLSLNYQPIVSLKTQKIVGFEALVRWSHPQRGFVSPAQLIYLAEKAGLIVSMGQWVLSQACQHLLEWKPQFPELYVSVNLSEIQLRHPHLLQEVKGVLDSLKLPAFSLKLEITESNLMENITHTTELLRQLKALKIRLLIDDFGTGYSSLSYLQKLPVDTLKIDRSFVQNIQAGNKDFEIAKTIINLAHSLGLEVVAEGIETPDQEEMLKQLGCEFGQGYLFSPPLVETEVMNFLNQNQ